MSTEPKSDQKSAELSSAQTQSLAKTHKGMKIFTYPKIIFIWPTLMMAIICGIGMIIIKDRTIDPTKPIPGMTLKQVVEPTTEAERVKRFSSSQNVLGVLFLLTFALNILVMAIDFPRFTVIVIILAIASIGFFLLWLNVYYDLLPPLVNLLESIFVVANGQFYFMVATVILLNFAVIWVSRYLDYWEILPNEILHNHGPFSDLERYPTMNLKFDKEIPDILEYALLRSGRLVLHVTNERKAIVLDNVLWIDRKEEELKKMMSRMEVRVTTDQEAADPM
jgi:hypothetical protein